MTMSHKYFGGWYRQKVFR